MKVKNCRFHSTEDFAAWQRESRRELIDLLGITDLLNGERCPLNPRSLRKRENELGTIEKIAFDSEPGVETLLYVTCPLRLTGAMKPSPLRRSATAILRSAA